MTFKEVGDRRRTHLFMTGVPALWALVAAVCVAASAALYGCGLSRILRRETGFPTAILWFAAFWIILQAPYRWYSLTADVVLTFSISVVLRKRSGLSFWGRGSMKQRMERGRILRKKILTKQFALATGVFLVSFALGIPIALGVTSSAYVIVGGVFFFGGTFAGTILLGIWFFQIFPVMMEAYVDDTVPPK